MLSGFNTNFRYRGVLFHVQTEDSGRQNPHVITHLFHGGNIIVSQKREYSKLLLEDDVEEAVRKLMENQHKEILRQLSRGDHDQLIGERLGPDVFRADPGRTTDSTDAPTITEEERPPGAGSPSATAPATPAPAASPATPAAPPATPPVAEPTVVAPMAAAEEGDDAGGGLSRVFGDRVVSEKPLDEVVLDYLVENARKRRRQPK